MPVCKCNESSLLVNCGSSRRIIGKGGTIDADDAIFFWWLSFQLLAQDDKLKNDFKGTIDADGAVFSSFSNNWVGQDHYGG